MYFRLRREYRKEYRKPIVLMKKLANGAYWSSLLGLVPGPHNVAGRMHRSLQGELLQNAALARDKSTVAE